MNIKTDIDKLGYINEQLKVLKAEADTIKKELKKAGVDHADGKNFRLDVITQERSFLDQKAVKEKLSPQFLVAHTRYATVRSYKVSRIEEVAA